MGGNQYTTAKWTDADYLVKLLSQCSEQASGCLLFMGCRGEPPRNYGQSCYRGKAWRAHRLAWFLTNGAIPAGMVVMHTCDSPPCCNTAHMRLGTHLENMADCRAKDRYHYANLTHCKRGHEFNEKNTYIIKTPGEAFGLRACRMCQIGRIRVKAGWPEDLAYSLPRGKVGEVPAEVKAYRESRREALAT